LKQGGFFLYIVGNKWLRANYGKSLRQWMKQQHIVKIIDFCDLPVFKQATTYPCIIVVQKKVHGQTFRAVTMKTPDYGDLQEYVIKHCYDVRQDALEDSGWSLVNQRTQDVLDKLRKTGVPLEEYVGGKIYLGVLTGLNEAFVIDEATRKKLITDDPKSSEIIKPFLAGKDIKRYQPVTSKKYVIFTRRGVQIEKYAAIRSYLAQFKERLMPRPKDWKGKKWKGRKPGSYQWYEIQDAVDYYAEFEKHKILWPGISAEVASFALDGSGYFGNENNQIIVSSDKYLLGILNSKNMRFLLSHICDKVQGGFYRLKIAYIQQVPIRTIKFDDPADTARHDRMVELVEQMLDLNKQLAEATVPQTKTVLQRQIETTDRQIDRLVYELYELTEEEIKIIEG
jgi:hypothetical protein